MLYFILFCILASFIYDVINPTTEDNANIIVNIYEVIPINIDIEQENDETDVHTHEIQNSLRKSLKKLSEWYSNYDKKISAKDTILQIKEHLFNKTKSVEIIEKAYTTIRHLEKSDGKLHDIGLKEIDILIMVWARINASVNETICDELKNNLVELLADSTINIDTPYCLVGRVTRVVQSLQSLDKEKIVDIKTKDIYNSEIQFKIPLLREKYFSENPKLLDQYNKGDMDIANKLVNYVSAILYKEYNDPMLKPIIRDNVSSLL